MILWKNMQKNSYINSSKFPIIEILKALCLCFKYFSICYPLFLLRNALNVMGYDERCDYVCFPFIIHGQDVYQGKEMRILYNISFVFVI
jgi:hypothetical protein